MISSIKNKRKKNDGGELSKYSQNAKIIICQESNVTLEKLIQSEMKNDNKKFFNHEFSKNDAVDYNALAEKKRAQNKNLKKKTNIKFC